MRKPNERTGAIDFTLFSTVLLLVAVGVVMVFSASSYSSFFQHKGDSMFFLRKQLLWAIIGIVCMFFTIKFDYHYLRRYTSLMMILTVILLLAVFAFPSRNGAQRWIDLKFATLQPSDIAKYIVVLYMAKSIENKGEKIKSFIYGIFPYLLVSGFYAGLVLAEKNLSIASVIMIVTMIVIFAAGARLFHIFGIVMPSLFGLGVLFTLLEPYRVERLMNFRNPWANPKDEGYQLIQSLLALGSGGIWGVGIGRSRQKCYYIPEPHNDFIFAIIGEELGLIGCAFIIILFLVFIWRGIRTAMRADDTYGTLLAIGITSVVAVQAVINIAVVTGSMPVTGVPLPFISYGGSSLVFNLIAMGILLNISKKPDN